MPKAKYKKRKDGRWRASIKVGTLPNGKPIKDYIYSRKSSSDLERKRAKAIEEIEKGIYMSENGKNITLKELKKQWILSRVDVEHLTLAMYKDITKNHGNEFDDQAVAILKPQHMSEIIQKCVDKPRTCYKIKTTYKQLFDYAIANSYISVNPCIGLRLPKYKPKEKRALKESELKIIQNVDFTDAERMYLYLILYHSCRRGECIGLNISNFNFNKEIIHIEKSVYYIGGKPYFKETKGKRNRKVPMIKHCILFYEKYIQELTTSFLFTNPDDDKFISQWNLRKLWESIKNKIIAYAKVHNVHIEFDEITSHWLRHNYATDLYYSGLTAEQSQRLMGHASSKMTRDLYTHLDENIENETIQLNNYYSKKKSNK